MGLGWLCSGRRYVAWDESWPFMHALRPTFLPPTPLPRSPPSSLCPQVTTAGVLEMEKLRPVDVLAQVGQHNVFVAGAEPVKCACNGCGNQHDINRLPCHA